MQVSRKMIVASLSALASLVIVAVVYAQQEPADNKSQPVAAAVEAKPDSPQQSLKGDSATQPEPRPSNPLKVQEPLDPEQRANVISIEGTIYEADGQPARGSQVWLAGMTDLPGSRYGAAQIAYVQADDNGKFSVWYPRWKGINPIAVEHSVLWVLARTRKGVLTSNVTLGASVNWWGCFGRGRLDWKRSGTNELRQDVS